MRTPRNPSTDLECALRYLTRKHRVLLRESVDRVLAVRELYVGGTKRFDLVRRERLGAGGSDRRRRAKTSRAARKQSQRPDRVPFAV